MALVDEIDQLIEDAMVDGQQWHLLKRLDETDFDLLRKLRDDGPQPKEWFKKPENKKLDDILRKSKARSLIVPVVKEGTAHYYYDATNFGLEMLKIAEQQEENKH